MVPPTIIVVTDDPSHDNKTACALAGADFCFDKATEDHAMIDAVRRLCMPQRQIESLDPPSPYSMSDHRSTAIAAASPMNSAPPSELTAPPLAD